MSSMDSTGRRGRVAEEQVLLNDIPSRNGVSVTPIRTPVGKRGKKFISLSRGHKLKYNCFLIIIVIVLFLYASGFKTRYMENTFKLV